MCNNRENAVGVSYRLDYVVSGDCQVVAAASNNGVAGERWEAINRMMGPMAKANRITERQPCLTPQEKTIIRVVWLMKMVWTLLW